MGSKRVSLSLQRSVWFTNWLSQRLMSPSHSHHPESPQHSERTNRFLPKLRWTNHRVRILLDKSRGAELATTPPGYQCLKIGVTRSVFNPTLSAVTPFQSFKDYPTLRWLIIKEILIHVFPPTWCFIPTFAKENDIFVTKNLLYIVCGIPSPTMVENRL